MVLTGSTTRALTSYLKLRRSDSRLAHLGFKLMNLEKFSADENSYRDRLGVTFKAQSMRRDLCSASESSPELIPEPIPEPSFEELLESSPIMKLGRPKGKVVQGKVTHVCGDDLYVDFGGKFEAIVKHQGRARDHK